MQTAATPMLSCRLSWSHAKPSIPTEQTKANRAVTGLLDQLSMLTIILTGAAILREREHGTLEHLLVMPLTSFEIAISKSGRMES